MQKSIPVVIELDADDRPVVRIDEGPRRGVFPVWLRGREESLTPAFRGHDVIHLEWVEAPVYNKRTGAMPEWELRASHDYDTCTRCVMYAEAAYGDELLRPDLGEEDWEALADRVQSFHRDYISRWDDNADQLDPMLDQMLRRRRARASIEVASLRRWLEIAVRYVRARMQRMWVEEDDLINTRTVVTTMRGVGLLNVPTDDREPTFTHQGTTWCVRADGETQRLRVDKHGDLRLRSWVTDPAGRKLPGYASARQYAIKAASTASQTPGQRRASSREVDMKYHEEIVAKRTLDLRKELPDLRARLRSVTHDIKGA